MFCLFNGKCLLSQFASENAALPISRLAAAYEDLAVGPNQKSFNELKEDIKTEERSCSWNHQPTNESNSEKSTADMLLEKDSANSSEASTFISATEPPAKMEAAPQTDPALLTKPVKVSLKRRLYTVAQLVVEPDSQSTSSSIGPAQEEDTQGGAERLQEAEEPSQNDLQSPVKAVEIAKPIRKPRRVSRRISR